MRGITARDVDRSLRRVGLTAVVIVLVSVTVTAWAHTSGVRRCRHRGLAPPRRRRESMGHELAGSKAAAATAWLGARLPASIQRHRDRRVGAGHGGWRGVCITLPLTGHAAGHPAQIALHALHVLAAGVWLGTLAAVVLMRLPAVSGRDRADPCDSRCSPASHRSPRPARCPRRLAGLTAAWTLPRPMVQSLDNGLRPVARGEGGVRVRRRCVRLRQLAAPARCASAPGLATAA